MRDPDHLRAFANRNWAMLARAKQRAWLDHRRRHGVAGSMRLADELWRQIAGRTGPEWDAERRADLETHRRVGEALRSVQEKNRRR